MRRGRPRARGRGRGGLGRERAGVGGGHEAALGAQHADPSTARRGGRGERVEARAEQVEQLGIRPGEREEEGGAVDGRRVDDVASLREVLERGGGVADVERRHVVGDEQHRAVMLAQGRGRHERRRRLARPARRHGGDPAPRAGDELLAQRSRRPRPEKPVELRVRGGAEAGEDDRGRSREAQSQEKCVPVGAISAEASAGRVAASAPANVSVLAVTRRMSSSIGVGASGLTPLA